MPLAGVFPGRMACGASASRRPCRNVSPRSARPLCVVGCRLRSLTSAYRPPCPCRSTLSPRSRLRPLAACPRIAPPPAPVALYRIGARLFCARVRRYKVRQTFHTKSPCGKLPLSVGGKASCRLPSCCLFPGSQKRKKGFFYFYKEKEKSFFPRL